MTSLYHGGSGSSHTNNSLLVGETTVRTVPTENMFLTEISSNLECSSNLGSLSMVSVASKKHMSHCSAATNPSLTKLQNLALASSNSKLLSSHVEGASCMNDSILSAGLKSIIPSHCSVKLPSLSDPSLQAGTSTLSTIGPTETQRTKLHIPLSGHGSSNGTLMRSGPRTLISQKLSASPSLYLISQNKDEANHALQDEVLHADQSKQIIISQEAVTTPRDKLEFKPIDLSQADYFPSESEDPSFHIKTMLANCMSSSLINTPDLYSNPSTSKMWLDLLVEVAELDPEFVLKLAVYTRQELNIRITANWLLAVASLIPATRPYLRAYFAKAVRLPSDWIEVAQLFQVHNNGVVKSGSLPTALRKAMASKFPDFDEYQLAKYNKNTKPVPGRTTFSLKQLIRKLHIHRPVKLVLGIIGKKYPASYEEFRASGIEGKFDEALAGKRMKLTVPETWETQVSLKGNIASTWEQLLDHQKLPYMAMLRNLRNMIQAKISSKHHDKVIKNLKNPKAVQSSRQFPFRFFSAYEVLDGIQQKSDGNDKALDKLIAQYQKALDTAVRIATRTNVQPIKGKSVLLANIGDSMRRPCTTARGLGKPRELLEAGLLLALMCKYACESCDLSLYSDSGPPIRSVRLKHSNILANVAGILQVAASLHTTDWGVLQDSCDDWGQPDGGVGPRDGLPLDILDDLLINRARIDKLIIMTNTGTIDPQIKSFVDKYRHIVNPELLFVQVDLSGRSTTVYEDGHNDVFVQGFSDAILRYIAERGDTEGQVAEIENIARKHNITVRNSDPPEKCTSVKGPNRIFSSASNHQSLTDPPIASHPMNRGRTVNVFISSTFRDMHGERDILTRFVFPELRARACKYGITVHEIDLRWGVTEEMARSGETMSLCLEAATSAHYFVGLLGERYGWIPQAYQTPASPAFKWLSKYPTGRSITELEMQCALQTSPSNAFFALRSPSFNSVIPEIYRSEFDAESQSNEELMLQLKNLVRSSEANLLDEYCATWGGDCAGKPVAADLHDFGSFFLQRLWEKLSNDFNLTSIERPLGVCSDSEIDNMQDRFVARTSASFVGRVHQTKSIVQRIEAGREPLIVVFGEAGSGKTAFLSEVTNRFNLGGHPLISHFVQASPTSQGIVAMLLRLCRLLMKMCAIRLELPTTLSGLQSCFSKLIGVAAERAVEPMVVILDGIDQLFSNTIDAPLSWIPDPVPDGVVIVVSTSTAAIVKSMRSRKQVPFEVKHGALSTRDREAIVRATLAKYCKVLDESGFNNQMRMLTMKPDARLPQYLRTACEELRIFSVYEQLTEHIARLPGRTCALFEHICNRLEKDLDYEVVSASFQVLLCSRYGIGLDALVQILRGALAVKTTRLTLLRFWRSISPFLETLDEAEATLAINSLELRKAATRRYFSGSQNATSIHRALAAHFQSLADPTDDRRFLARNDEVLESLTYHQIMAMEWHNFKKTITALGYIQAMLALNLRVQLITVYQVRSCLPRLAKTGLERTLDSSDVQEVASFVRQNISTLLAAPILTCQQALNEPHDSAPHKFALMYKDMPKDIAVLRWINKPITPTPCKMTVAPSAHTITSICTSSDGLWVASADSAGFIHVLDSNTGDTLTSFSAHSGIVSSVCFVGKATLCTAGRDLKVCFWHSKYGSLKAMRGGFTRRISSIASNQEGSLVAVCSWDGSTRCYKGKDGQEVGSQFYESPANSLAFSSDNRTVAIAYWDGMISVWDTFDNKLLSQLRGHNQSVQSVSFSNGGILLSCDLSGVAKLWSPTAPFGELDSFDAGRGEPVTSCTFSADGKRLYTSVNEKVTAWQSSPGQLRPGFAGSIPIASATSVSTSASGFMAVGYRTGGVRLLSQDEGLDVASLDSQTMTSVKSVACAERRDLVAIGSAENVLVYTKKKESWELNENTSRHRMPVNTIVVLTESVVISGAEDGTITLLHVPTSESKAPSLNVLAHDNSVTGLVLVPESKGRMISVSKDGCICDWKCNRVSRGRGNSELRCEIQTRITAAHDDWINDVDVTSNVSSPSSQILATASNDCSIKLWRCRDMSHISTAQGHQGSVLSVSFLSQSQFITAGVDQTVRLWAVDNGAPLVSLVHGIDVASIVACGQRSFFAATAEGILRYDLSLGLEVASYEGHEGPVGAMFHGPRAQLVTCGRDDKSVKLWDGAAVHDANRHSHSCKVTAVSISSDGSSIVSGDQAGNLKLWHIVEEAEAIRMELGAEKVMGHKASVQGAAFVNELTTVTCSEDSSVKLWSSLFDPFASVSLESPCVQLSVSATTGVIAVGDWTGSVSLLSVGANGCSLVKHQIIKNCTTDWISCIRFVQHGTTLLASNISGDEVLRYNVTMKNREIRLEQQPSLTAPAQLNKAWLTCVELDENERLYCMTSEGVVYQQHKKSAWSSKKLHHKSISGSAMMSLDGNPTLVTGSVDGAVDMWKFIDNQPVQVGEFCCRSGCTALSVSNDRIVAADSQGFVYAVQLHKNQTCD